MSLHVPAYVRLLLSLSALWWPLQDADPAASQRGEPPAPAGTATLVLKLHFPLDSTYEERRALVGRKLMLVGRSDLVDGPRGERLVVEVGEDLRIRAKGLHPWIYGLEVSEALAPEGSGAGVSPFHLEPGQRFYPHEGRITVALTILDRGVVPAADLERDERENPNEHQATPWRAGYDMVLPGSMPPGWPIGAELPAADAGWISVGPLRQTGEAGRALRTSELQISVISHFGVPVPVQDVVTDAKGVTRIGPLVPGDFRVQREVTSHDRHAFMVVSEDVAVSAGDTAHVTLDAGATLHGEGKSRCRGRVTFDSIGLKGVRVALHDELGVVARAITDRRGCYDMVVGVTGTLWLKAFHGPTGAAAAKKVELRQDERTWETLLLRAPRVGGYAWSGDGFAGRAESAGDLDGDGADDLLISDYTGGIGDWRRESCLVVSGGTGELLFRVPTSRFRRSCIGLGGVGDLDGDGTPDFATEFGRRPWRSERGERGIQVRSGKQGRVLVERVFEADVEEHSALERCAKEWGLPALVDVFPEAQQAASDRLERMKKHGASRAAAAGDLDGDGAGDLFMAAAGGAPGPIKSETLLAVSGRTDQVLARSLRMLEGATGVRLFRLSDLDGDGLCELLVGNGYFDIFLSSRPAVSVHSGADLSPMHTLRTSSGHYQFLLGIFGIHGCSLKDVNGDGVPDIAVCAMNYNGPSNGSVEIFSGKDGRSIRVVTKATLQPG